MQVRLKLAECTITLHEKFVESFFFTRFAYCNGKHNFICREMRCMLMTIGELLRLSEDKKPASNSKGN